MAKSNRAWCRWAVRLFISIAVVATAVGAMAVGLFALAMPPGMEPERISHYDPEKVPPGVAERLPPITDPDGMRDTFFYPDGLGKGRIVHMRFPANYVSFFGETPPRHSDSLGFGVVYPELASIASASVKERTKKNGGITLDEAMEIGIRHPQNNYLDDQVSGLFTRMAETKASTRNAEYEEIPVPACFADKNCLDCRNTGVREIIDRKTVSMETTDTFIEWDNHGKVTRRMRCYHTPRPECGIKIAPSEFNKFYVLSIFFHDKYLDQLPELINRTDLFFNSSVVDIFQ